MALLKPIFSLNIQTAKEQPAGRLGTTAERSDATLSKSKKPQGEIGKQQVLATAGDTVPIVFCKRANGVGGAWVQPSMIKTGTNDFAGSFLYAITQGEMVSSPQRYLAWTGNENIGSKPGAIILTHYYLSAAAMAASKNTCPITSGNIFCDLNTYSYIQEVFGSGSFTDRLPSWDTLYNFYNIITRGTGDTSNSVVQVAETDVIFINQSDGTDFTSAYWAAIGITPSPTAYVYWNGVYSGGVLTGGNTVGTIIRVPASGYASPNPTLFTSVGANGPYAVIYENATINNQVNPSNPASTGTLEGVQIEDHLSTYANPASPDASANFTSFADITFLEIDGNIFDAPSSGSYPTTTRQLCIFYDNGCKVDLYSAGLSGGVYTQGASNQFVDLAMHLFKTIKRVDGAATDDLAAPIDNSNLEDIASYCTSNGTFCNGVIDQSLNVIDFISSVAPFFLLSFVSTNGRYSFQPLLPKNGSHEIDVTPLTPSATFDESNILPGTFSKEYTAAEDRRAVNISLVWREVDPLTIGIQRTNIVRYPATGNDAPSIQYDMTDICTSLDHAILFGKYELAKRKYSTHSISFATPLLTTSLIPTQIIKVQRQRISSKGDNRTEIDWYQITNIKHGSDGISTVSAMHFPVDGSDIAEISNEVVNGTFEVI